MLRRVGISVAIALAWVGGVSAQPPSEGGEDPAAEDSPAEGAAQADARMLLLGSWERSDEREVVEFFSEGTVLWTRPRGDGVDTTVGDFTWLDDERIRTETTAREGVREVVARVEVGRGELVLTDPDSGRRSVYRRRPVEAQPPSPGELRQAQRRLVGRWRRVTMLGPVFIQFAGNGRLVRTVVPLRGRRIVMRGTYRWLDATRIRKLEPENPMRGERDTVVSVEIDGRSLVMIDPEDGPGDPWFRAR